MLRINSSLHITVLHTYCLLDDVTGVLSPVYSKSVDATEMWISLAEKAYAKAVGTALFLQIGECSIFLTAPYLLFCITSLPLWTCCFSGALYQQCSLEKYVRWLNTTCAMQDYTVLCSDACWCRAAFDHAKEEIRNHVYLSQECCLVSREMFWPLPPHSSVHHWLSKLIALTESFFLSLSLCLSLSLSLSLTLSLCSLSPTLLAMISDLATCHPIPPPTYLFVHLHMTVSLCVFMSASAFKVPMKLFRKCASTRHCCTWLEAACNKCL